ncbi:hypothetical protein EDD15DRAFT_754212 [Pisolithus albus]|nr:hypothetical protein EDD15DRAFT_754212 [Pisolithus albus]
MELAHAVWTALDSPRFRHELATQNRNMRRSALHIEGMALKIRRNHAAILEWRVRDIDTSACFQNLTVVRWQKSMRNRGISELKSTVKVRSKLPRWPNPTPMPVRSSRSLYSTISHGNSFILNQWRWVLGARTQRLPVSTYNLQQDRKFALNNNFSAARSEKRHLLSYAKPPTPHRILCCRREDLRLEQGITPPYREHQAWLLRKDSPPA